MGILACNGCEQDNPNGLPTSEKADTGPEVDAEAQIAAIAEIERLGGKYKINTEHPAKPIIEVDLSSLRNLRTQTLHS